ncbi:MAG: hypothetical protein LBK73_02005 [Treponema sp.]|jgi:hypothetical protein|nr:hypothetical protein [Treponema sp.]
MTTIFDASLVISDVDGVPEVGSTLDKLDETLDAYGVKHSFTLPHPVMIAKNPNAVVVLNYSDEDDMLVSLIYALFSKAHRGASDRSLSEALAKSMSRYNRPASGEIKIFETAV